MLGDTALSLINDHISSSGKKEMQKLFTLINFIEDMEYEHIFDFCQLSEQSINHPSKEVIVLLNTAIFKKQLSRFIIEKVRGLFRIPCVATLLTTLKDQFDQQFLLNMCDNKKIKYLDKPSLLASFAKSIFGKKTLRLSTLSLKH